MGLTPIDYANVSLRQFKLMTEAFKRNRIDGYKQNRNLMYIMAKLWSSKPPARPQDLWELPGDNDEVEEQSDDELAKLFEAVKKKHG